MRITLREEREKKEWTQQKLSEESGVPQNTISVIESGTRENPGIRTLLMLARALGVPVSRLYVPDEEGESG